MFLLFYSFDKSHSLFNDSILDFGHVPLFCFIAAIVLWALDWRNWPKTTTKNYILAGAIAVILAMLTEVLQQLTPERSFQVGDIVHDLIGSTLFLLIAFQIRRPLKSTTIRLINLITGILLIVALIPFLFAALDELRARRDFPLLASFETGMEMERWDIEERFERSNMHLTHGESSLRINLSPGVFPGASLNYPPRDWHGYKLLAFDAFLEGSDPLPLTVRINDQAHNEEYVDRYNRTFTLKPGPNQVNIDLSEVMHAPKGRLMDMEHIAVLCLFSYRLQEQRTVYFDNFRLEKSN